MEKKMRAQIEAAEAAEPAPLTPIPESPLIEVKGVRVVERITPLPVIPIPGPPIEGEALQIQSQRHAAIAAALRKLWLAASSREQAIAAIASMLEARSYELPGDVVHEALHNMERLSVLAQTAHANMLTAGWSTEDALVHIEGVTQQEGHDPAMAAAIVQEYMMYDAALVDRGSFPFIPPSTSLISAQNAIEKEELLACLFEQEQNKAEWELAVQQALDERQPHGLTLEDLTQLPSHELFTSRITKLASQPRRIEETNLEPENDKVQNHGNAPQSPRLCGHGLTRASQSATKDQDTGITVTTSFDHLATMHLFS